jgi:glucosamine kinase
MAFLIAVDGGGTSCRAVIAAPDGTPLGEGLGGPANIVTDLLGARDSIVAAASRAAQQAELPADSLRDSAAVLGLAGANIGDMPRRIAALLPFRVSHVETDARIALEGALPGIDGAVAVVGTGSVFIARTSGKVRAAGGWGLVVGDFCSGARLGRTLFEETLLAYDGLREPSPLTREIMAGYGDDPGAAVDFAQAARPKDFAAFAPRLFAHADLGDAVAGEIVTAATRQLEDTLITLIGRQEVPFCLLGGLAASYSRRLSAALKVRERTPQGNALQGALSMAAAMFGQARGGA